jgi:TP901 family phage tail tape measure protein
MAFDLIARLRVVDNLSSGINKAMGKVGGLTTKLLGAGAAIAGLGAGLSVAATAVSSFQKAMDFEAQLSSIQALTGATGAEMADMSKLALSMGADTKYSALEAAKGIEELLKAGIEPAAVQAGGLEAALNLATAGGLDLASASEIMSTALNAYKKDAMTAAEASNILAGTANASATGVEDLKQSLSAVSAVAAGFGMTFRDTNAAMGLFANSGVKGSDAGTSLKTMLQNLQPGTKDQIALFNKLGITTKGAANKFFTAEGKLKSLDKISGVLSTSLKDLTDMQRQAALEAMFGTDAVRAGTILYNEGADGVNKFYDAMSTVTALDVAKKKMDNAKGAVEQFSGAIETLQISALMPTMPLIKKMADAASNFITAKTPQITAAVEQMTTKAKNYFKTNFIDNQVFRDIPTVEGKVKFVIASLKKSFDKWYSEEGGSKQISDSTEALITYISDLLEANSKKLTDIGISLGTSIGSGMLSGLKTFAKDNPEMAAMLTYIATPGPPVAKFAAAVAVGSGVAAPIVDATKEAYNGVSDNVKVFTEQGFLPGIGNIYDNAANNFDISGNIGDDGKKLVGKALYDYQKAHPTYGPPAPTPTKRSGGLSRVPMDNYPILAHRDEMVLTKTQADEQRNGGGGSGSPTINIAHMEVRKESDIDAIAKSIARELGVGY